MQEAVHVFGTTMRDAGIGFDALTFVALRILEAGADECVDPSGLLSTLSDNGTLERSVELATDWLDDEAAEADPPPSPRSARPREALDGGEEILALLARAASSPDASASATQWVT